MAETATGFFHFETAEQKSGIRVISSHTADEPSAPLVAALPAYLVAATKTGRG